MYSVVSVNSFERDAPLGFQKQATSGFQKEEIVPGMADAAKGK